VLRPLLPEATLEQLAAIYRILTGHDLLEPLQEAPRSLPDQVAAGPQCSGGGEVLASLVRLEGKVDGLLKAHRGSGAELLKAHLPEQKEAISELEAARVFRLFGELLAMGTKLKAPPARVFDLMVFKKMTKAETALECRCAASSITKRVALIERHFAMPIERLRAFASDLKDRQRTVKGDRYARKKHGAARDELERYDSGDKPSLKEDDDGYLPEEKQSWTDP
jgi:hypothetical protein